MIVSSPCINAGINQLPWNNPLPVTDLAGEVRIYDDIIDMGAYEWQGTSVGDDVIPSGNLKLTNYPNPFNPETVISFQVPDVRVPEDMELCIYNIKGQKVRTYSVNQNFSTITLSEVEGSVYEQNASSPSSFESVRIGSETAQDDKPRMTRAGSSKYSIIWNGTDNNGKPVPSGIYFCKLKFGSRTASRKMILMK